MKIPEREKLRSMKYSDYLKTPHWQEIERIVRESAEDICQMCGDERERNLQVHHRTYAHRGYEDFHLEDVILLCDECHSDVHRKGLEGWPFGQSDAPQEKM